jgi:hypothetical protein
MPFNILICRLLLFTNWNQSQTNKYLPVKGVKPRIVICWQY